MYIVFLHDIPHFAMGIADFLGQRCNEVTIGNFFKHLMIYENGRLLNILGSGSLLSTPRCGGLHSKCV